MCRLTTSGSWDISIAGRCLELENQCYRANGNSLWWFWEAYKIAIVHEEHQLAKFTLFCKGSVINSVMHTYRSRCIEIHTYLWTHVELGSSNIKANKKGQNKLWRESIVYFFHCFCRTWLMISSLAGLWYSSATVRPSAKALWSAYDDISPFPPTLTFLDISKAVIFFFEIWHLSIFALTVWFCVTRIDVFVLFLAFCFFLIIPPTSLASLFLVD